MAKRRREEEEDDDYDLMDEEEDRPAKKVKGLDPNLEYTIITGFFLLTLIGMLLVMLF